MRQPWPNAENGPESVYRWRFEVQRRIDELERIDAEAAWKAKRYYAMIEALEKQDLIAQAQAETANVLRDAAQDQRSFKLTKRQVTVAVLALGVQVCGVAAALLVVVLK